MRPTITWVVIADGSEARFFANRGPGKGLEALSPESVAIDLQRTGEIMADRPGRSFDSAGQGRHAMAPPSDAKDEQKKNFLKAVAEGLNAAALAGQFDDLVIAAPPKALGELRKDLDPHALERLRGELHKDLVNTPEQELAPHFTDVLAL